MSAVTFSALVQAGNLVVSNVSVGSQNQEAAWVQFDVAWENSWRDAKAGDPLYFHDAAWIFFKVQSRETGLYEHVLLSDAGINPKGCTTGHGTPLEIVVPPDRMGMFVRRTGNGRGQVAAKNIKVILESQAIAASDSGAPALSVFAVEMVYVAKGAFKAGSGGTGVSELYRHPSGPYVISSEDAIPVEAKEGCLFYDETIYGGDQAGPIPAGFPKGFAPFYCMKYEITQGDYVRFLNTLTRAQQTARCTAHKLNCYMSDKDGGSEVVLFRNNVRLVHDPGEPGPRGYATVTPDLACSYMRWADVAAWTAWAGLRPMTELEYEKACRGPCEPVADEYAWGDTSLVLQTGFDEPKEGGTATPLPKNANCCCDEQVAGTVRVDLFEAPGKSRAETGASFWGIIGLSGNAWERAVTIGHPEARGFTGEHGNGKLTASGEADVAFWPGPKTRCSFRGGNWFDLRTCARVSDRLYAAAPSTDRKKSHGGRAARSAP